MATEWFVWHLWKDGSITQRKAAKLLNLSQKEFKNLLETSKMALLQHIHQNENAQ